MGACLNTACTTSARVPAPARVFARVRCDVVNVSRVDASFVEAQRRQVAASLRQNLSNHTGIAAVCICFLGEQTSL